MHYVYRLRSLSQPDQTYTGLTDNIEHRLEKHNKGDCPHTAKFRPWHVESYHAFNSRETAAAFERYLKSGSGREFVRRHFCPLRSPQRKSEGWQARDNHLKPAPPPVLPCRDRFRIVRPRIGTSVVPLGRDGGRPG